MSQPVCGYCHVCQTKTIKVIRIANRLANTPLAYLELCLKCHKTQHPAEHGWGTEYEEFSKCPNSAIINSTNKGLVAVA